MDVVALRIAVIAALSGLSMCQSTPEPEPVQDTAQTGPDGLIIRHAPTESVEGGALPDVGTEGASN